MKKLFTLLCIAFIAISASAVNNPVRKQSVYDAMNKLPKLELKAEKFLKNVTVSDINKVRRDAIDVFDCQIEVSNITAETADVTVTPADLEAAYITTVVSSEDMAEYGAEGIVAALKENMDYYIELYGSFGWELSYSSFATYGVDENTYDELDPATKHYVIAYGLDTETGEATTTVEAAPFTTLEAAPFELIGEKDITIVDPSWNDKTATSGWWQVTGYSADQAYWVTLSNDYATQAVGTYEMADMDMSYTAVYTFDEDGNETAIKCVDVTVVVTEAEDGTITIKADYTGKDGYIYHITAVVEPEVLPDPEFVNVHIVNPEWANYVDTDGWWQIYGASADDKYTVSLSNVYTLELEGEYEAEDMDNTYSYIYVDGVKQTTAAATAVVSVDENGVITVTGTVTTANGSVYTVTFDAVDPSVVKGDKYDMSEEDVVATFSVEDGNLEYDEEYGCLYGSYLNADNEYFSIALYSASAMIEDGVYEINETYAPGSVQAGSINTYVYPTFYGTVDDEGYINVPLFLCTGGNVTVSHDAEDNLLLDVQATNTWGRTASIKVTSDVATGIKNVTTNKAVVKSLQKNGIVIEKNGNKFNAIGQQMK